MTVNITELAEKVAALETDVGGHTDSLTYLSGSVDTFYYLFVGSLVFFMQAGFGLLEAGSVRTKNTKNILLKNLLDACIGAIVWWAWGYAVAVRLTVPRPARRMHPHQLTSPIVNPPSPPTFKTRPIIRPRSPALSFSRPHRRPFAVRDGKNP